MQIAPNFWLVAIMVALGMPAVVAPSETLYRKRILANLLVGIVASVTLFAAISVENQFSNSDSIYLSGNYLLSTRLSVVDAVIVTISILLATFRLWAWLGAVLVLSGPFLFVAVVYPLRLSSNASEPKLAALSLAIWTIAALILLWKSTTGKKIGVMSLESLIDERLESTLSP